MFYARGGGGVVERMKPYHKRSGTCHFQRWDCLSLLSISLGSKQHTNNHRMGRSKKSLKSALLSHQSRLNLKQKTAQIANEREKKRSVQTKGKQKASGHGPQMTIPFYPTDRILLVGEGNFSFARALVMHPPPGLESFPPVNVTATTYDTEVDCCAKYSDAREIVRSLREKGVEVLFEVDATRLEKCPALKGRRWNRVVWNFPHTGECQSPARESIALTHCPNRTGKGIADQDRNILSNQLLILGFLRSAAHILALGQIPTVHASRKRRHKSSDDGDSGAEDTANPGLDSPDARGTLMVTLRNVAPYTLWCVSNGCPFFLTRGSLVYPLAGTSQDLPSIRLHRLTGVRNPRLHTRCCVRSNSTGGHGKDTSTA